MINTNISNPEQIIFDNNARIKLLPEKIRGEFATVGKVSKDKVPNAKKLPVALERANSIKTKHLELLFLKK